WSGADVPDCRRGQSRSCPRLDLPCLAAGKSDVRETRGRYRSGRRRRSRDHSDPVTRPLQKRRAAFMAPPQHPVTPDGRYVVVPGKLRRTANSNLASAKNAALVNELQRGAVRQTCGQPGRGSGGASRRRCRQASFGRTRSCLVDGRNARPKSTLCEKYPVPEV